jgi:hypothetical protein
MQHSVSYPPIAGEPEWQLRGFRRLRHVAPSETVSVQLTLPQNLLSIYSVSASGWTPVSGVFRVAIGHSSADFELVGSFTI